MTLPQTHSVKPKHIATLDGLRGVAILMVLAIHFIYLVGLPKPPLIHWMFPIVVSGWMGVDLFFVLSGFLITGILLDTRTSENYFRAFYARRTLRIFPLYYLVIVTGICLTPLLMHSAFFVPLTPNYSTWLSYVFYAQNWWVPLTGSIATLVGAFWSLGVEEQFYLAWPLVIYKLGIRRLPAVCFGICLFCFILRLILLHRNPSSQFVFNNTLTRMDTLLWGGQAAIVVRNPPRLRTLEPKLNYVIGVCFVLMLVIDFGFHELYTRAFYTQSVGYSTIAIGFSALLLKAYVANDQGGALRKVLQNAVLRSFGKYSYGIYIYHAFILFALQYEFKSRPWFGTSLPLGVALGFVFLLSSYGIAFASYHLFESRFLRLKSKFRAMPRSSVLHHPAF